ncbi:MAG: nitronate monooxygenase [Gemmatimonadota bacterium]|nr:nitronate monooxygenase [Gemmatimonadota bacterium]
MTKASAIPQIIQGGMGVGVSNWRLARAVAMAGHLGVISGTGIDTVFVRRLQDGDIGGHLRRAMARFPMPQVAQEALRKYFRPDGRSPGEPYKELPMYRQGAKVEKEHFTMLATFVEVFLAKEGHDRPIGVNLLTKIQLPTLAGLYGAMLAGVDVVLMGAGIPKEVPGALDAFAAHQPASMRLEVEGRNPDDPVRMRLDPKDYWDGPPQELRRPLFFPIIASSSLATMLARKASGRVDGFIIEGPTAGGHNAPPRGDVRLNERGEPIYGHRDVVDLDKVKELGLPFWLAGGAGRPGRLQEALDVGAAGIQVGTLFAYSDESGILPELKLSVLKAVVEGRAEVFTDPVASPTGFPFKVVRWDENPADQVKRERVCDLGYLRTAYQTEEGRLSYRCASEPIATYLKKGGTLEETEGRKCLCNALMGTIGIGQSRKNGTIEPPLVTSGDDLVMLTGILAGRSRYGYSAAEALEYLLGPAPLSSDTPLGVPAAQASLG